MVKTVQFLVERACPEAENQYLTPEISARLPIPIWVFWPGDTDKQCSCGGHGFFDVTPEGVAEFDRAMGINGRPNRTVTVANCMGKVIE